MHNKLATADVDANVLKLEEVAVLPLSLVEGDVCWLKYHITH